MVDKWAELSRHPDFQAIYKEAILRAVRELRADPTRVAITMPWDLHQSCQLMMTDGGAVTLEGNHPHFCMDDPAFITEMTSILFDGATLVVHDRMRSLLRSGRRRLPPHRQARPLQPSPRSPHSQARQPSPVAAGCRPQVARSRVPHRRRAHAGWQDQLQATDG